MSYTLIGTTTHFTSATPRLSTKHISMEGLYKNDEQQALDAIITALQLLEGGTQCIHQHLQVKLGEKGTDTGFNGSDTRPNITSPNQSGHFASLSTPPNVPEDLANGGDVTSAPGAGSSSDRGLGRTGQVLSTSGVGDSSRVCQTYPGPVSDISDVGQVYGENATSTGALAVPLFVQRIADGVSMFDEDGDDPHLHDRRQGPVSGVTSTQPATKRKRPRTGNRTSVKAVQNIGKEQDSQKRIKARNIHHAQMSRRRRRFRQAVLEQETAWLQRDISRLEADIRCISEEVDVFTDVLMNHSCPDVISEV
ncbi:uncharacterized protein LOC124284188 isoform X2 [Haliotis rubra]|uniref:uncharacterized protein LOC124284188 isoform X2 n=1 Tax=Haliotis rubra TaxID=36100 RepID=UPI001EE53481|nr:uncharacterized protein LOC124284188 isoform X2 [Haliotis rubra]